MNDLVKQVLETTLVTLATTGASAIVMYAVRLAQRAGLAVSADQESRLIYLTKQAILRAEEYGAQRLKAQLPVSAADKLQVAVDALHDAGIAPEAATAQIHSVLPTMGLGATAIQVGK